MILRPNSVRGLYAWSAIFAFVGCSAAQDRPLLALVRNTCAQSCYINACPDLMADCVCGIVGFSTGKAPSCVVGRCREGTGQAVFDELRSECITRGGGGGSGGATRTQTTSSATTPTQTLSTSLSTVLPDPVSTSAVRTPDATPDPGSNGAGENSDSSDSDASDNEEEESEDERENEGGQAAPGSPPSASSSPANAIPIEDQLPGTPGSKESKPSTSTIALAVSIPVLFILLMMGAILFVRRQKLKRNRLSITTFMDKSAAYEPDISGPTNVMQKTPTSPNPPEMPFSFPLPPDMQKNQNVRSPQEPPRQHRDLRSNPFADPPVRRPPRSGAEPSLNKVLQEPKPKPQIGRIDVTLGYYEPEYMYPPAALPASR